MYILHIMLISTTIMNKRGMIMYFALYRSCIRQIINHICFLEITNIKGSPPLRKFERCDAG